MGKLLKKIIAESLFFRLYIIFLFAWGILLLTDGNNAFLIRINESHNDALDVFFKYVTHIGGGWFALGVGVLLLLFKVRWGIMALVSFLGSAAITQVLKRWVFDWPRPSVVFADTMDTIHQVPGVELMTQHTFPSGHSTCAFAVFCLLGIITIRKKYLGFLFCFLAIMAGFSRSYLFQHFPFDVLIGSLIGTLTSLFVFAWLNTKMTVWGDKSLLLKSK